jgi:nickel-type superoxide dismutase maturation protease
LFGRRLGFNVQGTSMVPALKDGETVLVDPHAGVEAGDIVLARHPYKQSVKVLKRVREIDAAGRLFLVGDNAAESTDSRTLGLFPVESIIGTAVCRLK